MPLPSRSTTKGAASGVLYLKGNREYFQPAKVVLLAGYTYGNVRLLLLSTSKAFPNGLRTITARSASTTSPTASARPGATGWFPGQAAKPLQRHRLAQFSAFDDLDARQLRPHGPRVRRRRHGQRDDGRETDRHRELDPTERSAAGGRAGRRGSRRTPTPWPGSGRSSRCCPTRTTTSTWTRELRDPLGRPVIRITNDFHENERRLSDYVQKKMVEWLKAAGAAEVWTAALGRSLAEHTCLWRNENGRRPEHERRQPLGHLARGAEPRRSWAGQPSRARRAGTRPRRSRRRHGVPQTTW